jgi:hypothetical protein
MARRQHYVGSMRMRALVGVAFVAVLVTVGNAGAATPRAVTVFLERDGRTVEHDEEEVTIPKFGGGDRAWAGIVSCVKQQFAPFQIDVVDRRPARGDYITAVIGGRASQLGLDDRSTNGVGPYSPDHVIRDAIVHIFSKVGTGEKDVQNLCAVTVHEVSHSLGLDHTYKCGDVMSYFLDRCGARKIMNVAAPCGEDGPRACGDGSRTQNSYRKLAASVGLRNQEPEPEPAQADDPEPDTRSDDPWTDPDDDGHGDGDAADPATDDDQRDEPEPETNERTTVRGRDGHLYSVEQVQGRNGRRWLVIRRIR